MRIYQRFTLSLKHVSFFYIKLPFYANIFRLLFAFQFFLLIQPKSVTGTLIGWEQSRGSTWRQRSPKQIRSRHLVLLQRRNMPQRFFKRGSTICTGSAEVTEGCHMRFTDYVTRILALLQEDGMGKGETSTGSHRFATFLACVVLCSTTVPPKQQRRQCQ